ncbi:MAG: hypothetical protein KQH53_16150 [Desulfarculaceae bacterium]|nr:hypothetical protein [Desulfarculaceae bacterium]
MSLATQRLGALDKPASVACLTNAGYATYKNQSTLPLYDELARLTAISPGRGNLLVRPGAPQEALYLMFLKKDGPDKLMMTFLTDRGGTLTAGPAMNIHVGVGTSFKPFGKALGPHAFNLVTLANGWAMGLPHDLMRAALRHGHLCCGVTTGYFTARYIAEHMPLKPGQRYVYIGAPAWCQDDYITDYLRITPGTHGYLTMSYPWSRPWKSEGRTYRNLGGVVIRWDPKAQKGRAWVLSFDWHFDAFRQYLGKPKLKLDWRSMPWLHTECDRWFMTKLDQPGYFVSVIKSVPIQDKAQLEGLTRLGANPLQVLLGPDPSWPGE